MAWLSRIFAVVAVGPRWWSERERVRLATVILGAACGGLSIVAGAVDPPAGAGTNPTSAEPPVVLPQMVIVDARDHHPWLYAKVPGLEILSKLDGAETEAYAEGFCRAEQMFAAMIPAAVWPRSRAPAMLIICPGSATTANAEAMRKIDLDRMDELRSNAPPTDAFSAARHSLQRLSNPNARQQLVSYYDADAVVFFNRRVLPWQSTKYYAAGNQGADLLLGRSLYRHWAEHRAPPLPPWLAEGLPAVIAQSHLNVETNEWGMDALTSWPEGKGFGPPRAQLRMLPLGQVFAAEPPPRGSPDFLLWSYESALFVRWAFGRAALWNFVGRAMRESPSEEVFRECFGFGYLEAGYRIRRDMPQLAGPRSLRVKPIAPVPALDLEPADDRDVRRTIAELERLESDYLRPQYPKIAADYLAAALDLLSRHKGEVEKDRAFMATWGLCALEAGDAVKAKACLEAMGAEPGIDRPRAYLALAQLRYDAARATLGQANAALSAEQARSVLAPLLQAMAEPPPLAETFRLLVALIEHSPLELDDKSRSALRSATSLFPADHALARRVEEILSQSREPAEKK